MRAHPALPQPPAASLAALVASVLLLAAAPPPALAAELLSPAPEQQTEQRALLGELWAARAAKAAVITERAAYSRETSIAVAGAGQRAVEAWAVCARDGTGGASSGCARASAALDREAEAATADMGAHLTEYTTWMDAAMVREERAAAAVSAFVAEQSAGD